MILNYFRTCFSTLIIFGLCSCVHNNDSVVVYVSVDQNYAEPVIERFEEQTSIRVLPVYDIEASKTTGLVNRLKAEKHRPQADVFWSGEFVQTLSLKDDSVLTSYISVSAKDIPLNFKDSQGYWTGFSGRARVFLVNTDLLAPEQFPSSISDILNSEIPKSQIAIALPLFGTSYTHAAALFAMWGPDSATRFFNEIEESEIQILSGNSSVRDYVLAGKISIGLTDTDDACSALQRGYPVDVIFPDQNGIGTLVVPNTVSLVNGAPNPTLAKTFIDYLLSQETLDYLIELGWCHVPLRESTAVPNCFKNYSVVNYDISLSDIYNSYKTYRGSLKSIFLR